MSNNLKVKRFTIDEFRDMYPDDNACLDKLFKSLYGHLNDCPDCGGSFNFRRVKSRRSYQCSHCGFQIYPTAGTVFEQTTTPLNSWFYAIYLQTVTRNGVAAKELERQLDVCYKTALRMAHQIKKLFEINKGINLTGVIESDSTLIGGKVSNKHKKIRAALKGKKYSHDLKMSVLTLLERGTGLSYHFVVKAPRQPLLLPQMAAKLKFAQKIYTDSAHFYHPLKKEIPHESVNHEEQEFVRGDVHTNTVEGFFSLLKRTIKGTHIHVSDKHLPKYVNEVAFRYYHRDNQDKMFEEVLKNVVRLSA